MRAFFGMPSRRVRALHAGGLVPASVWSFVPEIQRSRLIGPWFFFRLLGGIAVLILILFRAISSSQFLYPIPSDPMGTIKPNEPLRLVLMTLEYRKSTFSGNGVYAQSTARSLANVGNHVLVVSARPVNKTSSTATDTKRPIQEAGLRLTEMEVDVDGAQWGRLDWKCPWQSFADGITQNVVKTIMDFQPQWILVVDWSSLPAFKHLSELAGQQKWKMGFLNFRIYYISEYKGEQGLLEKDFYKKMESEAVSMASAIAALSSRDTHILANELGVGLSPGVVPKPLFPPLREDIRSMAISRLRVLSVWSKDRKYISCCVRLSPEKNADLFASIIESISSFLIRRGIVPFLCGGAHGSGGDYAESIKQRVKVAVPDAVVYEGFMGPEQLAEVYSKTLLNVHPCIYDAYGMTIVEAAAFEVPSIVHVGPGGAVGAAEFLESDKGQIFALDLNSPMHALSDKLEKILEDTERLSRTGKAASGRSLSWNEDANAQQLIKILDSSSGSFMKNPEPGS